MKSIQTLLILAFFTIVLGCDDDDSCGQCNLTPNPGPCEAYIPKYYYDQNDQECKEFIWGGCGGTVPFDTMEECFACNCSDQD